MIYRIFAIRDRAADLYGQPFYTQSTGIAIRSFTDEVNRDDPNNNLAKHPEDFDLFSLGEFDDNTGEFKTTLPEQIAIGKDVKR